MIAIIGRLDFAAAPVLVRWRPEYGIFLDKDFGDFGLDQPECATIESASVGIAESTATFAIFLNQTSKLSIIG
jgi:hypothetical protein